MKQMNLHSVFFIRILAIMTGILFTLTLVGCGGGGGGGPQSAGQNVTISGKVDDGTASSPIPSAVCRFVDVDKLEHATVVSDANGGYSIIVPPGLDGHVRCSPQDLPNLTIYTFLSTKGMAAGETISGEKVTPATTIVADIIQTENPPNPKTRKQELLASIETLGDEQLAMVAELSTMLFKAMYEQRVNVSFGGDGGGDGAAGDGGGVGGDAGDGGDFSPIPNARCEFIVGNNLKEQQVLYSAALSDFLSYGRVNRPDMGKILELVNSALANHTTEEIKAAFNNFFSEGIGQPYVAIADQNGSYFLAIPPHLQGFVRCVPPNQENLILATYVSERSAGEKLLGQDVTPATTVFSNNIATKLDRDISTTKENFLDDIVGLGVHIVLENGNVKEFQLSSMPIDKGPGIVAYTATCLFNICAKNRIDCDYLSILNNLFEKGAVDPAFLQMQGLSTDQTNIVLNNVDTAEDMLVPLKTALSTTTIEVTVIDSSPENKQTEAIVKIREKPSDTACLVNGTLVPECPEQPVGIGNKVSFTLIGDSIRNGIAVTLEAYTTEIAPISKTVLVGGGDSKNYLEIDLFGGFELKIVPAGDGKGFVISNDSHINCGKYEDKVETDCAAIFESGSRVTLSASAVSDSRFTGWSGSGCSGTNPLCILTLSQAYTVTATFNLPPQDISIPTVSINSPTTNSTYTTSISFLNIAGSASDDGNVTQVTWSNSRGGSGICAGTTSWSTNNISLSGGANVITVTARDAEGNKGTDTLTVTAEIYIPTVTITSPTPEATFNTYSSPINISGTASDDVGVTEVTWFNNRGGSGTCNGTTSWIASSIPLYEGNNVITVEAHDAASKTGVDTLTVIKSTNTSPTISNALLIETIVNSTDCNLYGTEPDELGSKFKITFDYTDPNGNGPTNISEAHLDNNYVYYPSGYAFPTSNYFWHSSVSGNGYNGSVSTEQCFRFGSDNGVDVKMTIRDQMGATSNELTIKLAKPAGSN